jgi:hypothetical protein
LVQDSARALLVLQEEVLYWQVYHHLKLGPGEGQGIILEIVVLLFGKRHEPLHDEEGERLKVGPSELSVEVGSLIVLEPGEEVLVELGYELRPIFQIELVVLVVLELSHLKERESGDEPHDIWIEGKSGPERGILQAAHQTRDEALLEGDQRPSLWEFFAEGGISILPERALHDGVVLGNHLEDQRR